MCACVYCGCFCCAAATCQRPPCLQNVPLLDGEQPQPQHQHQQQSSTTTTIITTVATAAPAPTAECARAPLPAVRTSAHQRSQRITGPILTSPAAAAASISSCDPRTVHCGPVQSSTTSTSATSNRSPQHVAIRARRDAQPRQGRHQARHACRRQGATLVRFAHTPSYGSGRVVHTFCLTYV